MTGFPTPRAWIRCARRWESSRRRWPSSQPPKRHDVVMFPRRPRRRPKPTSGRGDNRRPFCAGPARATATLSSALRGGWAYSFQTMSQPGRADPQTTTAFLEPPPTTGRLRTGDAASVTQSRSPGIPSAGKVATVLWPIVAARQAVMKAARSIDRLYPL